MAKPQLRLARDDAKAQRSPEREALAKAIATRDEAQQRVDAVGQAQETAANARRKAQDTFEAAEANVLVAQRASAQALVANALGKPGPAPQTVREARQLVQDAKDELQAAEEAEAELARELKSAESKRQLADLRYREAMVVALEADPAVLKLDEEKQQLLARLKVIEAAQCIIGTPFGGRTGDEVGNLNQYKKQAPEWWDSVVQLRDDADAPLPD